MEACKTCKFWKEGESCWLPKKRCTFDNNLIVDFDVWGDCATLMTSPDFGCTEHKEKE